MEIVGVAVIAVYAGLYGLLHSLLATDGARALARRLFGSGADRWYRLAYNVVALATLLPIELISSWFPDRELYVLPAPWYYLVLLGRIAALAGVVYCITLVDASEMAGLRQAGLVPPRAGAAPTALMTSGVYGWVRHPLYLAALGLLWFAPQMTIHQLALYLVFTGYLYVGTFFEERKLVQQFGKEYLDYRQRVHMFLPFG
jgi:methanethiol S-methyltransferase